MLVRAHECVMDGFERFAQGHLITLFSATNYCGTANNAGAILVLGRDLVRMTCCCMVVYTVTTGDGAQAHPPAATQHAHDAQEPIKPV